MYRPGLARFGASYDQTRTLAVTSFGHLQSGRSSALHKRWSTAPGSRNLPWQTAQSGSVVGSDQTICFQAWQLRVHLKDSVQLLAKHYGLLEAVWILYLSQSRLALALD